MPYAAENIADFWRRWHISLSNWLRDYLYFSLPGLDRKSTRLNSSHTVISYAVFCLKKKIELVSLWPHRHVTLVSYSKSMRQRILLIAALMDNPDLLIRDEPLSGLDVTSVLIVKNLIQALSARGKSVFYCSHILEVVEKVCTHLIVLRKGQVIAHGATSEVRGHIGTSSLEGVFLQLVEEKDVTKTANEIVDVVVSA